MSDYTVTVDCSQISKKKSDSFNVAQGRSVIRVISLDDESAFPISYRVDNGTLEVTIQEDYQDKITHRVDSTGPRSFSVMLFPTGGKKSRAPVISSNDLSSSRDDYFYRVVKFATGYHEKKSVQETILKSIYLGILLYLEQKDKTMYSTMRSFYYDNRILETLYFVLQPYDDEDLAYLKSSTLSEMFKSDMLTSRINLELTGTKLAQDIYTLSTKTPKTEYNESEVKRSFIDPLVQHGSYGVISNSLQMRAKSSGLGSRLTSQDPSITHIDLFVREADLLILLEPYDSFEDKLKAACSNQLKLISKPTDIISKSSIRFDIVFAEMEDISKYADALTTTVTPATLKTNNESHTVSRFATSALLNNFLFI